MVKVYIIFFMLCLGTKLSAQVNSKQNLETAPKEIQQLFFDAKNCVEKDTGDCSYYHKKAIKFLENKNSKKYLTTFYCYLGKYYFNNGRFKDVIKDLPKGYKAAKKRNEYYNAGFLANLLAAGYSYQANTDSALFYFIEARKNYLKINDSLLLAENYSNTASVYVDIDDDVTAVSHYYKAWAYSSSLTYNMRIIRFSISLNLGQAYNRLGKLDSAYNWALISRKYVTKEDEYKSDWQIATNNMLFADVYMKKNQLDSAYVCAKLALQHAQKLDDSQFLADAYAVKANVHLEQKDYRQAIKDALESKAINTDNGNVMGLTRSLSVLSKSYFALGKYKEAAYSYKQELDILDSTVSQRKIRAIREVNVKYETEKKERQIAEQALKIERKNTQFRNWVIVGALLILGSIFYIYQSRKTQKQKLILLKQENENAVLKAIMNSEEQERRNISSMLHDGVAAKLGAAKMSLQSIPFLQDEKRDYQLENTAQLISNIHRDIRSIAHSLLPVTLEKEGLVPAIIGFVSEINQLHLLEIKVDNKLPEEFILPKKNALVIYRIIQELINNIVRHAKATEAKIYLEKKDNVLEICVSDNGVGFIPNQENQGLYSIKERLNTIGGTFTITNEQNGSVAVLSLRA
ncbi:ATP-binding protein [Flavobacterium sp. MK4S-17]|uniref:ATP-binding protein n=1 Tax=Flavobacterium sp. MK4S-17 TaxID=2543737 RepID=UPI0013594D40|nr:ATP-binding protein [Flavobacterium sp. MK4S-17]